MYERGVIGVEEESRRVSSVCWNNKISRYTRCCSSFVKWPNEIYPSLIFFFQPTYGFAIKLASLSHGCIIKYVVDWGIYGLYSIKLGLIFRSIDLSISMAEWKKKNEQSTCMLNFVIKKRKKKLSYQSNIFRNGYPLFDALGECKSNFVRGFYRCIRRP